MEVTVELGERQKPHHPRVDAQRARQPCVVAYSQRRAAVALIGLEKPAIAHKEPEGLLDLDLAVVALGRELQQRRETAAHAHARERRDWTSARAERALLETQSDARREL